MAQKAHSFLKAGLRRLGLALAVLRLGTLPAWGVQVKQPFYMIMSADPQYPRSNGPSGSPAGESDNGYGHPELSEQLNRNEVKSMNALISTLGAGQVRGVVVNGDLTEYGQLDQYTKYRAIWDALSVTKYPGLGNHDYANNVNDLFENNGADRMVLYLRDAVHALGITSFDFTQSLGQYKFPTLINTYQGSLAYSWDIDNVHFVQLNNYPTYHVSWSNYISGATVDGSPGARDFTFNITSALDWLRADLTAARSLGKVIILNWHDPSEHIATTDYAALNKIFSDYSVSAIFVGHEHHQIGRVAVTPAIYGKVPVFFCGSTLYNKYLLAHFTNTELIIDQVDSTDGGVKRTPITTKFPLLAPVASIPLPPTAGWVIFQNAAGFVSRCTLTYSVNGTPSSFSTGDMSAGGRVQYAIPAEAANISVSGQGATGLADSPFFGTHAWNTFLSVSYATPPKLCFRATGTTLSQHWDNACN